MHDISCRSLSWFLASLLGASTAALAQHALYDAGVAGNPPVAPDPQTQGWWLRDGGGGVVHGPINGDGGLNAWEIADSVGGPTGYAYYASAHDVTLGFMSTTWEVTVTMRMTAGPDPTIVFGIDSGGTIADSHYHMQFEIVGVDVLAYDGMGGGPYRCIGGALGYHTYTIRKTNRGLYIPADFLYDGVVLGSAAEQIFTNFDGNVFFGTLPLGETGRARFHRVELRSLDDLGTTYCSPAVANSTGSPAALSAEGSPYVNRNFLELSASQLPAGQFGYFLAGRSQGMFVPPGSQGVLCLSGNIGRFNLPSQIVQGPTGSIDVDLTSIPINPPQAVLSGETWNFQCWYRDVHPTPTSNFTDAVSVMFL